MLASFGESVARREAVVRVQNSQAWQAQFAGLNPTQIKYHVGLAVAARHVLGGNCAEHAALAFFHLIQAGSGDLISIADIGTDHQFVLIRGAHDAQTDWVICDPWVTRAQAVRFVDHFLTAGGGAAHLQIRVERVSNGADLITAETGALGALPDQSNWIDNWLRQNSMGGYYDEDENFEDLKQLALNGPYTMVTNYTPVSHDDDDGTYDELTYNGVSYVWNQARSAETVDEELAALD